MHRLRSPLVALITLLVVVGPISGRITQIDPTDPLQISTPSAWERSRQETLPVAEPALQFSHSGITEDSGLRPRHPVGDDILLASPTEIALVERSTMGVLWEFQPEFELLRINTFTNDINPRIALSGADTCMLLDATSGDVIWENPDCQSGSLYLRADGVIEHTYTVEDIRTIRFLDEATGEESWSHSYLLNPGPGSKFVESADHQLIFIASADSVEAVTIDTGETLWTTPIVAEKGILVLGSHVLVLQDEEIIALDAATGAEIWLSFMVPGYLTHAAQVQPHSGEKLIVSLESSTVILDVSTGLEIAQYQNATVRLTGFEDSEQGSLYPEAFIMSIGNDTVGVDWVTLEEQWRVDDTGSPSLHYLSNSKVLVMTTENGRTLLIDTHSGQLLKNVLTTALSSAGGGDIILFRFETSVEAYDTVAKRNLWHFTPPDGVRLWNNTTEHVLISNQRFVYVIDANTGDRVKETAHPDGWQRYILNVRFALHWNGNSITVTHHLTGSRQTLNGIYDIEDLSISGSGNVAEFRYGSTITLLDRESGKLLYRGDLPIEHKSIDGEYVMLLGNDENRSLQVVEPTGDVRWQINVPAEFSHLQYYQSANKVLLQARTRALLIDAQSGDIIMELPVAYDPNGDNDTLYISEADAVLVGSNYASAIYQIPAPTMEQLSEETTLRGAPSISGVERATFPADTPVISTGNTQERADGLWLEVTIDGITGWVHEDSLNRVEDETTPVATP